MARTRMSARKVTGGSAPRSNWQRAPTAYRKPSKPQAPEVSRPEEPAPDNTSDAENGCCICLNGGNLIVCSRCPRVCCDGCIPMVLKENDVHLDNETVWLCPSCHVTSTRAAPDCRATPYFGFYKRGLSLIPESSTPLEISGASQATINTRVSTSPTVILHFILSSIGSAGSPAHAFVEYLRPYFGIEPSPSHFIFMEFPFSHLSQKDASAHQRKVKEFIETLSPTLSRVYIFVTTHSDVNTGELFWEPTARCSFDNFCEFVITQTVLDFCKHRESSLFFLACGSFINSSANLDELKALAQSYFFSDVFSFTASGLLSTLTAAFFIEYAQSVVLDRFSSRNVLHALLSSSRALSRHSNIVHLHGRQKAGDWFVQGCKLTWTHKTVRPNGCQLPLQCSTCKCIAAWRCQPPASDGSIEVRCMGSFTSGDPCSNTWSALKPPVFSKVDESRAGIWIEQAL